jgi:hypothetical protein
MQRIKNVADMEVGKVYKVDFPHANTPDTFCISRCIRNETYKAEVKDFINNASVKTVIWWIYKDDIGSDTFRVYYLPKHQYPQYYV